ncbi:30S ribosomal protein S9 [Candidatus Parcubacteria bacterium]|nr:MAG: 30S ribosomal protein S9 [Candidatus Parcubacteria bacterium]
MKIEGNKKENKISDYIFSVGRRKEAVARVRLYNPVSGKSQISGAEYKKGDFIVNNKPIQEYFKFYAYAPKYNKLFRYLEIDGKYIFSAKVRSGGLAGQLDALILGVARSLDKLDKESYRGKLKEKGYLTRDARERERRKVGTGGKARRKKQSPKR